MIVAAAALAAGSVLFVASTPRAAEVPEAIVLAPRAEGDRGSYDVTRLERAAGAWRAVPGDATTYDFEWARSTPFVARDGTVRTAQNLVIATRGGAPDPFAELEQSTTHFDASTGEVLGRTDVLRVGPRGEWVPPGGVPAAAGADSYLSHLEYGPWTDPPRPPCGFAGGPDPSPIPLRRPAPLFGACRVGDRPVAADEYELWARDRTAGRDAWVLHAPASDAFVWLAADVPYPLRFIVPRAGEPGAYDVARLARFVRGDAPLGVGPAAPPSAGLPALEWTPPRLWGPDESGVDHPFPLSDAFQVAQHDLQHAELRDFLRDHPDAFTEAAHYGHRVYATRLESVEEHRWAFVVTAGAERLFLDLTRADRVKSAPLAHTALPIGDAGLEVTYRYGDASFGPPGDALPWLPASPTPRPDRLPTVASLFAFWQAYAAAVGETVAPGPANAWGFGHACFAVACDGPAAVWAGRDDDALATPLAPGTARNGLSLVAVDGAGRLDSYSRGEFERMRPPEGNEGLLSAQESSARVAPPPQDVGAWALPARAFARATATVALAALLLYWAWPHLKAWATRPLAATGLYTRIDAPDVLRHPVRARIVDEVQARPGIHFQALARRLGLAQGAAQHHLAKLVAAGVLTTGVGSRYTCYFVRGRVDRRVMAAMPLLKADGARRVLAAVLACPGANVAAVAAAARLDPGTVSYHVKRLRERDVVTVERSEAGLRVYATDIGRQLGQGAAAA